MCCFDLRKNRNLEIPVVLDRVIGGSLHLDEASRAGQHLLSIVDAKARPNRDHKMVSLWQ
jgi:hypothetical protein